MKRGYIIVTNDKFGSRSSLTEFLNNIDGVSYWYACMPNSVFYISTLSAKEISTMVDQKFGTGGGQRHFITEVTNDRNGWMPKQVWHMFSNLESPRLPKK